MGKTCRLSGRGIVETCSWLPVVVLWVATVVGIGRPAAATSGVEFIKPTAQGVNVEALAGAGEAADASSNDLIPLGVSCRWAYGVDNPVALRINNTGTVTSTFIDTAVLAPQMSTVAGSCTTDFGTCTIEDASTVQWTAMLAASQSAQFGFSLRIADSTPSGTQLCVTFTLEVPGGHADPPVQICGATCGQPVVPTATPTRTPTPPASQPTNTPAQGCQVYHSSDVPKNIPDLGSATSTINVPSGSAIGTVRVTNLQGVHTFVQDLEFHLISPAGTDVTVIEHGKCGADQDFNLGLDDASSADLCPLNDSGKFHHPSNPLATFDGQSPVGTWTLRVNDLDPQDSGQLQQWAIEICPQTVSPGCVTKFSTDVPHHIPDLGTAISTLDIPPGMPITSVKVVSLQGTHTFVQDLEFHLISPAGTDVTVIEHGKCGAEQDFNLGLDDASNLDICPLNDGGKVHHPSHPLAAFNGQNPGGTWTLKINDVDPQDEGDLQEWALQVCSTPPSGCTTYDSADIPKDIPDLGTATSTITVPHGASIGKVIIPSLQGEHTFVQDLEFHLISPAGTDVTVIEHGHCGADQDFNLGLDDASSADLCPLNDNGNVHHPSNPLAGFNGEDPGGTWTLKINDVDPQDSGRLEHWQLEICPQSGGNCFSYGEPLLFTETFTAHTTGSYFDTVTLPPQVETVPGTTCLTATGTCTIVNASTVTWSGTATDGQTIQFKFLLQLLNSTPPGTQFCINDTLQGPGGSKSAQVCGTSCVAGTPTPTPTPCNDASGFGVHTGGSESTDLTATIVLPAGLMFVPPADGSAPTGCTPFMVGTCTIVGQTATYHGFIPAHGEGGYDVSYAAQDSVPAGTRLCPMVTEVTNGSQNSFPGPCVVACGLNTPTPTHAPTLTQTPTPTRTFTPSRTPTPTRTQTPTNTPQGLLCNSGDVLAAVGHGIVRRFDRNGNLLRTLDTTERGEFTTGMAFDRTRNLYVTNFSDGSVSKFDPLGNLVAARWASGLNSPESIIQNAAGDLFVSQVFGPLLKLNLNGAIIDSYDLPVQANGHVADWIDLASDQCTIAYASETSDVRLYDVCARTQLPDFANGLPGPQFPPAKCFALRIIPRDVGPILAGSVIVACDTMITGLNPDGSFAATLDQPGEDTWFAVNLDPDGQTFWSGGLATNRIYHFSLVTGLLINSFTSNPNNNPGEELAGLAICDEPLDSHNPTPTPTFTPTDTPTETPPPTDTPARTDTPTRTFTPTKTLTPTRTNTPTGTQTTHPTDTRTVTPTITPTGRSKFTFTPTATASVTRTPTISPTATVTPTGSRPPTATASPTPTMPTATVTSSRGPTFTATPTGAATTTATATRRSKFTFTPTATMAETATPTVTPTGGTGQGCASGTDCQSGNCVDGRCCSSASCPAGEFCNIPTREGMCAGPGPNGAPCDTGQQCDSGNCVDGFCCATDSCPAGEFCNSGECQPPAGNGTPCGDARQCRSGFCVDGFCCASAMCPTGQFCTTGLCGGPGENGAPCSDPAQCRSGFCTDGFCCGTQLCPAGQFCNTGTCSGPSGNGTPCGSAEQCASTFCVDRTCCATATCPPGELCNIPNDAGMCAGPAGLGNSCVDPTQCQSGECTDGACCNAAACAAGQSCSVPGSAGSCTTITQTCGQCVGDCDCNREVTIDELITMVNIALNGSNASACRAGDPDGSDSITIDEIITAVNNALNGCPTGPTPTPTPGTGGGIPERAAGTIVGLSHALSAIPAVLSSITQLANGGTSAGLGDGSGRGAAVQACSGGGTRDLVCTQTVPTSSPRNYTLTFTNCLLGNAAGTVAINGMITGQSTDTGPLALCSLPPTALSTLSLTDVDVVVKNSAGSTTLSAHFNLTGSLTVQPDLFSSCKVAGFSMVLNGTATVQSGTLMETLTFTNTNIVLNVAQFSPSCVPVKYDMTLNGGATFAIDTLGSPLSGTFTNFKFADDTTSGGDLVTVSGQLDSTCFGTTLTFSTPTQVSIPQTMVCPSGGVLLVTASGNTDRVTYTASGGVDLDLGNNSSVDQMFTSCLDPQLHTCPGG